MANETAGELRGVDVAITKAKIDEGQGGDCWCCPVALGLNSVLDSGYQVSVDVDFLSIYRNDEGMMTLVYEAPLPDDVADLVADFDEDEDVEPCILRFELPRRFLKTSLQSFSSGA